MTELIKIKNTFILVNSKKEQVQMNTWYYEADNSTPIYRFTKDTLPEKYYLNKIIAGVLELPSIDFSLLSDEECSKIGYINLKKLADKVFENDFNDAKTAWIKKWYFIKGFKKAQSLNDNCFTLEDIKKAYLSNGPIEDKDNGFNSFIESLQQSSWSVEIETEDCDEVDCKASCSSKCQYPDPIIVNNSIKITKLL